MEEPSSVRDIPLMAPGRLSLRIQPNYLKGFSGTSRPHEEVPGFSVRKSQILELAYLAVSCSPKSSVWFA